MVQQSNHETRGTEKVTQGPRTREQQQAIIQKRERSDGIDVDPRRKSLAEAREDVEQPAGEYEISHGDRSIRRGANQESEHHKRRQD
ncbi:hypothetical protein [Devosia elaeis]|uniref:Uncharacterized protein n=1 Tax=Devosia elaeis TaxID=1770058 RepID=A0A178HXK0_9HYPH|nr:hypothetical protein [Devosia elaeis]OAM77571.1 hypothetical protein A3840_09505 [Devosia elaeis]